MKMRTKGQEGVKKVSRLQKSQDENVGWWNNHTEEQKIAMGLRYPYYVPLNFKKTKEEREKLKDLKSRFKIAQANA